MRNGHFPTITKSVKPGSEARTLHDIQRNLYLVKPHRPPPLLSGQWGFSAQFPISCAFRKGSEANAL